MPGITPTAAATTTFSGTSMESPVPLVSKPPAVPPPPVAKKQKTGSSACTGTGHTMALNISSTSYTALGYSTQFRTATWSTKFTPMHFISMWKDDAHKDHLTVAFSVPSGVIRGDEGLNGKIFPSVSEDGKELIVKCHWPNVLASLPLMAKAWKREKGVTDRQYHNQNMSAEQEIASIRAELGISDEKPVYSEGRIKLHVECERVIKKILPCVDKSRGAVIYVLLKVKNKNSDDDNMYFDLRSIDEEDSLDGNSSTDTYELIESIRHGTLPTYDNSTTATREITERYTDRKRDVTGTERNRDMKEHRAQRPKMPPKGHSDYHKY